MNTTDQILKALKKTLENEGCWGDDLVVLPIEQASVLGPEKAAAVLEYASKDPMDVAPQQAVFFLDLEGRHCSIPFMSEVMAKLTKALLRSGLPYHLGNALFHNLNWTLIVFPGVFKEEETHWGRCRAQEKAEREARKAEIAKEKAAKAARKAEREQKARERHERTLIGTGTCQCCGRNIKLRNGKLVDHGYECPRDIYSPKYTGHHEGNCIGTGCPPYEKSAKLVAEILADLQRQIEQTEKRLADLKEGRATSITRIERKRPEGSHRWVDVPVTYTPEMKEWDAVLSQAIYREEDKLRHLRHSERHYRVLLAIWRERPLPTEPGFEELHKYLTPALQAARAAEKA